ncbi:hypothetical protein AXF42_Ash011814 [Apostasia shenzhenica]|uniref:DUF789 domain-containing protein n=1 Tax=Apostasia shenzhenica TaxID=1088818 RepID=A0A2I0AVW5_9ASPA|nr:hypothetical protein AXF42_Ash011814 [Apostasia shenzhenica]
MSGEALHLERVHGAERFHGSGRARRGHYHMQRSGRTSAAAPPLLSGVPESRLRPEFVTRKTLAAEAAARRAASPGNLERFLKATMPSVPAQVLSKTSMKGWGTCGEDCRVYFTLGDLWESFKEWSAYGAGVPLVLNRSDSIVQYYVPYLSGIQLYADSRKQMVNTRHTGEDSDAESYRDSSGDGSSDSEIERESAYSESWIRSSPAGYSMLRLDKLTLDGKHVSSQDGFSSDDSDSGDSQVSLIFEYLEHDQPFCRQPLADKIFHLAKQFPLLKTMRSCDLLPTSWFSVAWYPIYRIPTGPTLRDLDACFLTFHSLSTPIEVDGIACGLTTVNPCGVNGVHKISLPVFGLESYKFKSSIWLPNGGCDVRLVNNLLQAADNWLQSVNINLPDYCFFASQRAFRR